MLYSVHYVGGESVYDSPIAQTLFPGARRMAPSWGSNLDGTEQGQGQGQDTFWPKSQSYKPSASGSGGLRPLGKDSPNGGEREASPKYPVILRDGYDPLPTVQNIHDNETLPEKTVWEVGWWGST